MFLTSVYLSSLNKPTLKSTPSIFRTFGTHKHNVYIIGGIVLQTPNCQHSTRPLLKWRSVYLSHLTAILYTYYLRPPRPIYGRKGMEGMVHGTWYMTHGARHMVHNTWCHVHDMAHVHGTWWKAHGIWDSVQQCSWYMKPVLYMVHGTRYMVHGPCPMVHGVQCSWTTHKRCQKIWVFMGVTEAQKAMTTALAELTLPLLYRDWKKYSLTLGLGSSPACREAM